MLLFTSYLCFLTCGISVLFILYLFLRFRQFNNTFYLIALIFSIFWVEFYIYALNSKVILELTFLFRTALPFRGLMPVFLWLYVWKMLHPNQKINLIQVVHFIIPLVLIICLLPDFLESNKFKVEIFQQFYLHNNALMNKPAGFIPAGFIQPFLLVYGLMYAFYTLYYIYRFSNQKGEGFINTNKIILKWLKLVSCTIALFISLQMLQYLSLLFNGNFNVLAQIGQSVSLIIMKSYLLLNPLVIENMDGCIDHQLEKNDNANQVVKLLPTPNTIYINEKYFVDLQSYLIDNKAYLNPDIAISKISIDLGINKNKLSTLIQKYYNTNFAELINRLRIKYFIDLVNGNSNLTMETLIYESGFFHRSTFYAAFKKYIGINPTTYLKEHNNKTKI